MFSQSSSSHTRRRFAALGVVAAVAVPALAACGTSSAPSSTTTGSSSPKVQVQNAFNDLDAGSTLTTTLRLGLTATQLEKLARSGFGGQGMTPALAQEITGAQLSFEEHATSGALSAVKSFKNVDADFHFAEQGTQLIDVKDVSNVLYIQAEVQKLLAEFHAPADIYGNLKAEVAHLPTFVTALLDGKYVSLPVADLSSIFQSFGSLPKTSSPSSAQTQQLLQSLKNLFTDDVKVTRLSSSGDGGTYLLTGNVRTLVSALLKDFSMIEPSASQTLKRFSPKQIPSKTIKLGLTIASGKVSQISVDLAQFASKADGLSTNEHLPLDLNFSTATTPITAPSGATPVNLSQLQGLLSLVSGSSPSSA